MKSSPLRILQGGKPTINVAGSPAIVLATDTGAGRMRSGDPQVSPVHIGVAALRAVLKETAERVVAISGVDRLGRWVRRGRAMILAYHNVVPDEIAGVGDRSLHLPLSAFRRQLDLISRECQPLPLADVLCGRWIPQRGRLPVAITFDDAYRGAVALALPELADRGLAATVFVAPDLLGDRTLWWDALAAGLAGNGTPDLRTRILELGGGKPEHARALGTSEGVRWQEMSELFRTCTEAELTRVVTKGECTVGSHTWSHASLTNLDENAVAKELARSRSWLRDRYGEAYVDVVSYPFGHWSPSVEKTAESCGYQAALALTKGSIRAGTTTHRFRLPRMNVPAGLSETGMRIRMGWR
jgi:peptidoglycan/xylan/chitin deacetylase (PgdA/CDA1 family)